MSPAGFEPATTCNYTGITATLELPLYQLSYGGLVQIPPETPFGVYHKSDKFTFIGDSTIFLKHYCCRDILTVLACHIQTLCLNSNFRGLH